MNKIAKIGLIQVDIENTLRDSIEKKQDHLISLAEACLKEGADLVFFPEAYQYESGEGRAIYHSPDLGKITERFKMRCSALAREYKAYVVPWDAEVAGDGKRYNTSYILDREGQEIGRHRKVHLTYGEQEHYGLSAGDRFPVFDLDIGRVGIMICFDNYFPESARALALQGAQLILYPLYGDTLTPQWELRMRARAVDNMVYVASCQLDNRYNIAYTGLVNPQGAVVCALEDSPSHRVVEVEMGKSVITSTGGVPEYHEDLKQYLLRVRNPVAYAPLLEPAQDIWRWTEIFKGKLPG